MINLFIFLSMIFFFTLLVGWLLEKARIPWVFASLIIGFGLGFWNPFVEITETEGFGLLADLGMYFLLFMIGYEVSLKNIRKKSAFLFKLTFFAIVFEAVFTGIFIHFSMGTTWIISFAVSLSFATIGEEVILPILDEFKLSKKRIGQTMIDVGIIDDIFDTIVLSIAVILIGIHFNQEVDLIGIVISFIGIFALTSFLNEINKKEGRFQLHDIERTFFLAIAILFCFIGIGKIGGIEELGALFAGISVHAFIPKNRRKNIEGQLKAISYGFFIPVFFVSICLELDLVYVSSSWILVLLLTLIALASKSFGSWLSARKELGNRNSILLGIGLSAKFSMTIVITKMLYDSALISLELFSLIVVSGLIFTIGISLVFPILIKRWLPLKSKE